MRRHERLSSRRRMTHQSALEILEPIVDRFVLPTIWGISLPRSKPNRARISAHDNDLENAEHQRPRTLAFASDSATIKLP
jgi:hypothetical protein